jgi:hypothetical protein
MGMRTEAKASEQQPAVECVVLSGLSLFDVAQPAKREREREREHQRVNREAERVRATKKTKEI